MEETRKKKTRTRKRNSSSQTRRKTVDKKMTELDEKIDGIKEEKNIEKEEIKTEVKEEKIKEPKKENSSSKEETDTPEKAKFFNVEQVPNQSKVGKGIYFGYYERLILSIVAFVTFLFAAVYFAFQSVKYEPAKNITYSEKSDIDYKVCLKDNEYYQTKCLSKDDVELYVANLIDTIPLTFTYDFGIEENANINFNYSIIGRLSITDDNGQNVFLEKEYVLLDKKAVSITDDNKFHIEENVDIDYGQYNNLANSFKSSYGLDTSSTLKVYLKIEKENADGTYTFDKLKDISLIIPLSERAVNIKLDFENVNESKSLVSDSSISLNGPSNIAFTVVLLILSLYSLYKLISLTLITKTKKSAYDKYVNNLLKEYDRLIVETLTAPDLTDVNIIKVKSFEELLDVRDNLKIPVMYYVITPHHKCCFYIKHENDVYIKTIKAIDLEGK